MTPCFFPALICFWMDFSQLPAFEALLPAYYNHCKFSSFARQLNYYGKVDLLLLFLVVSQIGSLLLSGFMARRVQR